MGMIEEVDRRISFLEFERDRALGGCGVGCLCWNIPFCMGGEAEAAGCLTCWKE